MCTIFLEALSILSKLCIIGIKFYNNFDAFDFYRFESMPGLQTLSLYNNNFTSVDQFPVLVNLTMLALQNNQISNLQNGTFSNLRSLNLLYLTRNRLTTLSSNVFEGLSNLTTLYLNFNFIEDLPETIFTPLANLETLGLWGNQIKTINRHYFGNLNSIRYIDLDDNVINAFERSVFDEAENLQTLNFWNNLCASGSFSNILQNRTNVLQRLGRCFRNHEFIVGKYETSKFLYQSNLNLTDVNSQRQQPMATLTTAFSPFQILESLFE